MYVRWKLLSRGRVVDFSLAGWAFPSLDRQVKPELRSLCRSGHEIAETDVGQFRKDRKPRRGRVADLPLAGGAFPSLDPPVKPELRSQCRSSQEIAEAGVNQFRKHRKPRRGDRTRAHGASRGRVLEMTLEPRRGDTVVYVFAGIRDRAMFRPFGALSCPLLIPTARAVGSGSFAPSALFG